MKEITLLYWQNCPYCISAKKDIEKLYEENSRYRSIPLVTIETNKQPELASKFSHYYVPCFYIGEEHIAEGVLSIDDIRMVFDKALAEE